jgi:hypothetical protein
MPRKCREQEVMHYYGGTCVFKYHVCDSPMSPAEYLYDPHGSPRGRCDVAGDPNCSVSAPGDPGMQAGRAVVRNACYDGLPLRPHIVNGRVIEDYVVKFHVDRCWHYAYVVVYQQFPADELMGRIFVHGHGWEIGSAPPEGVVEIEVEDYGDHVRGLIGGVLCSISLTGRQVAPAPPAPAAPAQAPPGVGR